MATLRTSAGVLLFRRVPVGGGDAGTEVLLGHMGGPFWARKDAHAWSIIKGEYVEGKEEPLAAAHREFLEETGHPAPGGAVLDLGEVKQSGGKRVRGFAIEGDFDPAALVPGTFTMEWPPRSGKQQEFPEIDRVEWMGLARAREKIVKGQVGLLDALEVLLASGGAAEGPSAD